MIEIRDFSINGKCDFKLHIPELIISSGQFIQVFGSNNSGKSLLLKTIAGQYKDFEGKFLYNGIETKPASLCSILLSSQPAILKKKSVEKNLKLPFTRLTKRKKQIMLELMKNSQLIDRLKDPVYQLSRSQQKSMELIRAVVQLPHYLLIDDYDTFFDNNTLNLLSSAFEFAASAGTTIITTSLKQITSVLVCYKIQNGVLEKL